MGIQDPSQYVIVSWFYSHLVFTLWWIDLVSMKIIQFIVDSYIHMINWWPIIGCSVCHSLVTRRKKTFLVVFNSLLKMAWPFSTASVYDRDLWGYIVTLWSVISYPYVFKTLSMLEKLPTCQNCLNCMSVMTWLPLF